MNSQHEDTYFLDRDLAYQTALAHNIITRNDGEKAVQLCFYDGTPFEHAPENLVHVPASEFSDYFSTNTQRLPAKVETAHKPPSDETKKLQRKLESLLESVKNQAVHETTPPVTSFAVDAFFLDPEMALEAAKQQHAMKCANSREVGTQICYYSGPTFHNAPDNLVNVPYEELLDFFSNTRLRLPRTIVFHKDVEYDEKDQLSQSFGDLLKKSIENRNEIGAQLLAQCQQSKPVFAAGQPLKVLLSTSRYDDLKRPVVEGFITAFEQRHCYTRVVTEHNTLEQLDAPWLYKEHLTFNPHVTLTIDSLDTHWLHPDVFNLILWWTPGYDISLGTTLSWRERDIVLPSNVHDDTLLARSGAKTIINNVVTQDANHPQAPQIDYTKAVDVILETIQNQLDNKLHE